MSRQTPSWFKEIDHTGDIGIAVLAEQLDDLFERAAWGMFAMLTDPSSVQPVVSKHVKLEAPDRDALMVRWLSELNYLHLTRRLLFSTFRIERLSEQHLVATARGEPFDSDRHRIFTEIKAVTFHGLEIRYEDGLWHAQIIFDM